MLVLQQLAAQCLQLRHDSFLAHNFHLPLYHSTSYSPTCRQTTSNTYKSTQHWYDYHKPSPIYRVSQEECARIREGVPYVNPLAYYFL